MLHSAVDHLVLTAASRDEGMQYLADVHGIRATVGGAHPAMGTHNALVRLGDDRYLEVIARDPAARPPSRPRWFALDRLMPGGAPGLATWVVRTNDIERAARASGLPLGAITRMTRGALEWQITIPEDGELAIDGAAPALIQWPPGVHPAASLPDSGCVLSELAIVHPRADAIARALDAIGFSGPVRIGSAGNGTARMSARLRTPRGLCVIERDLATDPTSS